MITYTIDGFNVNQPDQGFTLLESSSFAPPISPNRINLQIPRMHGQVPLWGDELTEAKLRLRVRITGEDSVQLQMRWEHLRRLMGTGHNHGLTIRRESGTAADPQVTSTFAQLETMSEPEFWCAVSMVHVDILFNIPSGRWESIETFDHTFSDYFNPEDVAFVSESTAPNVSLLVRIQGPFTSTNAWVRLFDRTSNTGVHIQPGVTFDATEYLLYDAVEQRVWLNSSDDFDARDQLLSGAILRTMNSGFLSLVPQASFQVGVSTSAVEANRSVSANTSVTTLRGRRAYI